jgi:hypothetical protein
MENNSNVPENSAVGNNAEPVPGVDNAIVGPVEGDGAAPEAPVDEEAGDDGERDPWEGVPSLFEPEWINEGGEEKVIWKEKPITLAHVQAFNNALRNGGAFDDERAHSREDDLLRGIVSALVSGKIPIDELRAIAKELLDPDDPVPGFAHWCA